MPQWDTWGEFSEADSQGADAEPAKGSARERSAAPRAVFVRALSKGERRQLEGLIQEEADAGRGPEVRMLSRVALRARIILLSDRGRSLGQIARMLRMAKSSVSGWIHRYEKHGIGALVDRPRSGRPRKVNAAFERRLFEILSGLGGSGGSPVHAETWTFPRLVERLVAEGFPRVCEDSIRLALQRRDWTLRGPNRLPAAPGYKNSDEDNQIKYSATSGGAQPARPAGGAVLPAALSGPGAATTRPAGHGAEATASEEA